MSDEPVGALWATPDVAGSVGWGPAAGVAGLNPEAGSGSLSSWVWSVSELTARIRRRLETDLRLQRVRVRGEIHNAKRHSSGHVYFTLRDQGATLRCVMFRSAARQLTFVPEDGLAVLATGRVRVYEPAGQYQLYVDHLEPDGLGSLFLVLEQTKGRLAAEGLFDPDRKRPLPLFPRVVGVVTSADGAALRDILRVAIRRNPRVHLVVAPVPVQGEGADRAIAEAIGRFDRWGKADVLIVGRGGGSREDLWTFNSEVVVRAIAQCSVPVISAVGHEVDYTLADLAADVRAPTPSAAAELAVPDWFATRDRVGTLEQRLARAVRFRLDWARQRLERLRVSHGLHHPRERVAHQRERLQYLVQRLGRCGREQLVQGRHRLAAAVAQLEALSPLGVLARGYSIARKSDGSILRDAAEMKPGDRVEVVLARGRLIGRVEKVEMGGGLRVEEGG